MALVGLGGMAFIALSFYDAQQARNGLLAILSYPMPFDFTMPSAHMLEDMTQPSALFTAAGFATVILILGLFLLASARTAMRPANQSQDGLFEITLNPDAPRVGTTLRGRLGFMKDPRPGQVFRLDLTCFRDYVEESQGDIRVGSGNRREVGFSDSQDVETLQDAYGWGLPFAFEIPATAPVSVGTSDIELGVYHWKLNVHPTGSWVNLRLGAATQEDIRAQEARQPPELKSAVAEITRRRAAAGAEPLRPHEYERLRKLSPQDLAIEAKGGYSGPSAGKVLLIIFGVLFGGAAALSLLLNLIQWVFRVLP